MKNMKRSRGFCLAELMVVMALAVMVLLLIGMTLQRSSDLVSITEERMKREEEQRLAFHYIASDLRKTAPSQFTIAPDGKSATFRVPAGFNGVTRRIIWSAPITYRINSENQLVRIDSTGSKVLLDGVEKMDFKKGTLSMKNYSLVFKTSGVTPDHKRELQLDLGSMGTTLRNDESRNNDKSRNNDNNRGSSSNSNNNPSRDQLFFDSRSSSSSLLSPAPGSASFVRSRE